MATVITSKKEGFRRCGVVHSIAPVTHPDERFTADELERLLNEPMLTIEVWPDHEGKGGAKDEDKSASEGDDKSESKDEDKSAPEGDGKSESESEDKSASEGDDKSAPKGKDKPVIKPAK